MLFLFTRNVRDQYVWRTVWNLVNVFLVLGTLPLKPVSSAARCPARISLVCKYIELAEIRHFLDMFIVYGSHGPKSYVFFIYEKDASRTKKPSDGRHYNK